LEKWIRSRYTIYPSSYNKNRNYNLITNNCRTFVRDVMARLKLIQAPKGAPQKAPPLVLASSDCGYQAAAFSGGS